MTLISSLNIHGVKSITIQAEREYKGSQIKNASRTLVIETEEGKFEMILFSAYKKVEEDGPYMEFIV